MLRNARIYVCTAAGTPTWDQFLGAVMDAPWSPLELQRYIGAEEPLTFTLHEDCSLRSIRHPFVEIEMDDEAMEDPLARLRADLTLELANIEGTIDMLPAPSEPST